MYFRTLLAICVPRCDFDAAGPLRAEGVTNVPVRGADTREECAERVMSQHPTANGASFQTDINTTPWCFALFNMTECDLSPCADGETCSVDSSAVDSSRPSGFGVGYSCSSGARPVQRAEGEGRRVG